MTALSPRLAHLLIHEDRSTGTLVLPNGTRVRDTRASPPQRSPGVSPKQSPATMPFDTCPLGRSTPLPPILPAPRGPEDRRPSQSIFSLLNDARPVSPRTVSQPPHSAPLPLPRRSPPISPSMHHRLIPSSGHGYNYYPPSSAPAHPSSFDNRGQYFREQQQQLNRASTSSLLPPSRPDIFRRHSGHPYDSASARRPSSSYIAEHRPSEELDIAAGSRAPISRTTKACNACRARKVRCDAGGATNGEPSTCSRCRESGVTCVYSGPQKKRGPCPGTVRQVNGNRSRRPSNRSSVTSIATTFVTTPPSEDDHRPWSARSSYGFPPPGQAPATRPSPPTKAQSIPVLSWPGMQPAIEVDHPKVVFQENYSMQPITATKQGEGQQFSLPPLRVAFHDRRESHYTPC